MKRTTDQTTSQQRFTSTRFLNRVFRPAPFLRRVAEVGMASIFLAVSLWMLALPAAADISTGLVAYYPLNGSGQDLSGYGRDATSVRVLPTPDRSGAPNGACFFNGDAYFIASAQGLPSGERTVALWLRWDESTNTVGVMPIGYGGGVCGTSWIQVVYSSSILRASHCGDQWMVHPYSSGEGQWHHWVVTTSAQVSRMYLDGEDVGQWDFFVNNTNTYATDFGIGAGPSPDGDVPYTDSNVTSFVGDIDEVRIYDRALSAADVAELYGFDPLEVSPETHLSAVDAVWPNPSRSGFEIRFSSSASSVVGLLVYDIRGRKVAEVPGQRFAAGLHVIPWDGRDSGGQPVPSGMFLARLAGLEAGGVRRLVVLR
jgi:hypothetical protein